MSEKKDINRLFQERFKDFEVQPPDALWNQIEKQLPAKKKNRKAGWILYSGIAAGLALLFSLVFLGKANDSTSLDQHIVNQEESTTIDSIKDNSIGINKASHTEGNIDAGTAINSTTDRKNSSQTSDSTLNSKRDLKTTTPANNTASNNATASSTIKSHPNHENKPLITSKTNTGKATPSQSKNSLRDDNENDSSSFKNGTAVTIGNATSNKNKTVKQLEDQQHLFNDIFENHNINQEVAANDSNKDIIPPQDSTAVNQLLKDAVAQQELEKKGDSLSNTASTGARFQGSTLIAPVYSNAGGSSLNNNVANNERSAGYNLSYGVALGYQLNDRWAVRAGVHRVDVSYNTQDVRYGSVITTATAAGKFDQSEVTSAVSSRSAAVAGAFPEIINNSFKGFDGELTQQLGYIEMPLEVRYNIINSRLKVSMTGGFSALFLQENNVRITNDNQRLELGSDDNFRDFNQSANIGIGLDYGITDTIGITLEPMFKYQLNAIERNTANFRPYTLGMYSGLTFKF